MSPTGPFHQAKAKPFVTVLVYKMIFGAAEIVYSKSGGSADYYSEKMIVVSAKIKKLWRIKVSGGESSHFEKNQFKVVQQFGCFFIATTIYRQELC